MIKFRKTAGVVNNMRPHPLTYGRRYRAWYTLYALLLTMVVGAPGSLKIDMENNGLYMACLTTRCRRVRWVSLNEVTLSCIPLPKQLQFGLRA